MQPRLEMETVAPGAEQAMLTLERYVHGSGLDRRLVELVKVRASQMNGCAYCIDMHWKDARALGETDQRLYSLSAWREAPFYSQRERAALAWAEAITAIGTSQAPDELYAATREQFSAKELVDLTMAVVTINAWNRLMIAFRAVPGTYQPSQAG